MCRSRHDAEFTEQLRHGMPQTWRSATGSRPRSTARSDLVENAKRAEAAGFEYLLISDHIHPWVDAQGHSPFVWGVLGAIAQATERIRVGTAVTCPLIRMHPAVVAHAAATAQSADRRTLLPRRRHGREPERARARRPLAARRRAPRDARGGGRGDQEALRRRVRDLPRQALHGRAAEALRRAERAPAPIVVAAKAENAAELAASDRRRHDEHVARRGDRRSSTRTRAAPGRSTAR